jgi:hypothetical protein
MDANAAFRGPRLDESGQPKAIFFTRTGHLDNHFAIGPAILWSPFLLTAHAGVLLARAAGSHVAADGFSAPYRVAMALGTACYGFLGLLLSFRLARQYCDERVAFLATLGIWWASSLPMYMYFNPSWSHAHSAFAVALFFYYWHRTRGRRTLPQWCLLGAIAGLMLDVYYANGTVLIVLAIEAASEYRLAFRAPDWARSAWALFARHFVFAIVMIICVLPTFITRYIIYGNPFESGYVPLSQWFWRSPFLSSVLFSADHGLLVWTPILMLALAGLFIFWWRDRRLGPELVAAVLAFYLLIACYPDWNGISSYGNRFFVSLTILFVFGLGIFLESVWLLWGSQRAAMVTSSFILAAFILWNLGFMFQWGTHLVPARGPISWSEMVHNQVAVVPRQISEHLERYLFHRRDMMKQIEERDIIRQMEERQNQEMPK